MSVPYDWVEFAGWVLVVSLWCIVAVSYSWLAVHLWRRRRAAGRPQSGEGTGDVGARR